MRRVLVIGSPGAGKSRFARALGARTGLAVVHLDAAYWMPGWREPAHADWEARLDALLAHPAWIIDGNYARTLAQRLRACDAVVLLDLPRWLCLWRVLWRMACSLGRVRDDMAPGCPERFDPAFLLYVWGYRRHSRPKVLRLLEQQRGHVAVYRLRSRAQVRRFLAGER
jgi:adenylate kinase family enzyme